MFLLLFTGTARSYQILQGQNKGVLIAFQYWYLARMTVTKLLAIPKLKSGTAAVMSDACLAELRSWGLEDRIVAMCFDTTASNTGCKGGVCIKLEAELGKDLLNLACRHHCLKLFWKRCFHCMILQGLQNWNYSVISMTSGRKSIRPSIAKQWMIKMQHSVSQKFETM